MSEKIFDLSVILPCYLEEENLRILLPRMKKVLDSSGIRYEVLIVDTESPLDSTQAVCTENQVTYLNRKGDNYYGSAIRTGILNARGKSIIFMDADGSHQPEFILKLFAHKNDADIVIASRYVKGGFTENSKSLIFMSKIVNLGFALVLGIKCKDISNSFKLYDSSLLKNLSLRCENFDIVEEILYKCLRQNKHIRILEIPFTFKQRLFGETKRNLLSFVFSYLVTLIRLRFFV